MPHGKCCNPLASNSYFHLLEEVRLLTVTTTTAVLAIKHNGKPSYNSVSIFHTHTIPHFKSPLWLSVVLPTEFKVLGFPFNILSSCFPGQILLLTSPMYAHSVCDASREVEGW